MKRSIDLFFILLRSAIWNSVPELKHIPSEHEWNEIFRISKEQTVTGILLDAISKLPQTHRPPQKLLLQWIATQKIIEKQNIKMNSVIKEIYSNLSSKGIRTILLKGQGVAQNYPHPLHRQCGDIDLYFTQEHINKVLEYFRSLGCKIEDNSEESHAETEYKGFNLELHKKSATFYTKKLQKKYNDVTNSILTNESEFTIIDGTEIEVLPHMLNAFQLLSHMMRHIIFSGLGLRQVCDWVMFTYKYQSRFNHEQYIAYMKELQLFNTYKAITVIAIDNLGLSKDYAICEINSEDKKNAQKILNLIMAYGNFGHYGEHDKIENKLDYLKSYIWKVKNCFRFRKLAGNEAWNYPIWQLHSVKKIFENNI